MGVSRPDRKRKKQTSNKDWTNPHDPDAKVTKMQDKWTHLAHKVEHAVDLDTGAIVAVTVQGADRGDTTTIQDTLAAAVEQHETVAEGSDTLVETAAEVVANKWYHSPRTVLELATNGFRVYISQPARGRQSWIDQPAARDAVYANPRRLQGNRGRQLMRRRGERIERSFCARV